MDLSNKTYGFIGLGLIGGSIARAIRAKLPEARIVAYDIDREALIGALADRVVTTAASAIDEAFASCDMLFLCAPVQKNNENLRAALKVLSPDCLITDVGSVKTGMHEAIHAAGLDDRFIGGHPMTGSERVGYANSKAILLENAYYILTPTDTVPREKLENYRTLVETLGAIPLVLDYKRHDHVVGAISHLPHVVAASLVNLVRTSDSEDGLMKMIAAGGFKDITRIASSSAQMWQQICLTNTENISELLGNYIDSLRSFKEDLDARDGEKLYERFDSAREYRDSFSNTASGPIKKANAITVDIVDEAGSIATIATLLAVHQISIRNIGITHNRESETGVLRIEFHNERDITRAAGILSAKGYAVYTR